MHILLMTRCKRVFFEQEVDDFDDYLSKDLFFSRIKGAFEQAGHRVTACADDSYFIPSSLAFRSPLLYRALTKLVRLTGLKALDRRLFSAAIGRRMVTEGMDALFTEVNFQLSPEHLKREAPSVRVTQWFGILPGLLNEQEAELTAAYDACFCPVRYDDWLLEKGIDPSKFVYMQSGMYDPEDLFNEVDQDYAYDVCFIGGVGNVHQERIDILERVALEVSSFGWYGYGEEFLSQDSPLRAAHKGWSDPDTLRKVFSSSRIAINIPSMDYDRISSGFNIRLIEIPACAGALQLCSHHDNIREFFSEGVEIITFSDKEELMEQIRTYLAKEDVRSRMVEAAAKRVTAHRYEVKIHDILSAMGSVDRAVS